MSEPRGRKIPVVTVRDIENPTPDVIEAVLQRMVSDALGGLVASNQTQKIKRLILVCDDQAIGDSLQDWAASLEPGWINARIVKFNN